MVTAVFYSKKENCSFEEVLESVKTSLRQQLTREHLEDVISYNVSNEKKSDTAGGAVVAEKNRPSDMYMKGQQRQTPPR